MDSTRPWLLSQRHCLLLLGGCGGRPLPLGAGGPHSWGRLWLPAVPRAACNHSSTPSQLAQLQLKRPLRGGVSMVATTNLTCSTAELLLIHPRAAAAPAAGRWRMGA